MDRGGSLEEGMMPVNDTLRRIELGVLERQDVARRNKELFRLVPPFSLFDQGGYIHMECIRS